MQMGARTDLCTTHVAADVKAWPRSCKDDQGCCLAALLRVLWLMGPDLIPLFDLESHVWEGRNTRRSSSLVSSDRLVTRKLFSSLLRESTVSPAPRFFRLGGT